MDDHLVDCQEIKGDKRDFYIAEYDELDLDWFCYVMENDNVAICFNHELDFKSRIEKLIATFLRVDGILAEDAQITASQLLSAI